MRQVTFAAIQFACSWDTPKNIAKAKELVRAAAAKGANVVLLQELFETPYFCQDQCAEHFGLAKPFKDNPLIAEMAELAKSLSVVLPVSFFERAGRAHFNSLAMVDADGTVLGLYRKSHIPAGPGYQEKFYFTPGDLGFHDEAGMHPRATAMHPPKRSAEGEPHAAQVLRSRVGLEGCRSLSHNHHALNSEDGANRRL